MAKLELKNPVSEKIFDTREALVDDLCKAWNKLAKWRFELQQEEELLLSKMNEVCGETDKTKGVVKAFGDEFELKLTRRENNKYEKERGADHPLLVLSRTFAQAKEFFALDIRERGGEVDQFLENVDSGLLNTPEAKMLAEQIKKVRSKSPGKPEVEVKVRKA